MFPGIAGAAASESTAQEAGYDLNGDDTAEILTESTVDYLDEEQGLKIRGDLRFLYDKFRLEDRNGETERDDAYGMRYRLGADYGITEAVHLGARIAGTCFNNDNCDPEFVFEGASPAPNGLEGGQFTFDELYLHWFKSDRGSVAVGRLQTRFTLRGGVFAKSLDRNDSNNMNVTWTDGLQAIYRAQNGWNSSFVYQRNQRDGTGSIRRPLLDFDDRTARNTYFTGFENTESHGLIVQRAFDVSYLPDSLLKDGDLNSRREDYWGYVGRLALRWPNRNEGIRLRAGAEVGYAPETPTRQAADIDAHVSGLAWDALISLMDIWPGHSVGIDYAQTGAGWLLSPQFRPNEELLEIQYQWRKPGLPLLELRARWREDMDQRVGTDQKQKIFDMFLRVTWQFDSTRR